MEKIISDFKAFENDKDIFNKSVHNLKFWSYVRFSIFWSFYSDEYLDDQDSSTFKLLGNYIFSSFRALFNFVMLSRNKYDFIFINTSRRTNMIDNNDVDIYTYPFIKALNKEYKILLLDVSKFENSDEYPCDFLPMRFANIFNRVFSFLFIFSKNEKNYIRDLGVSLNKVFQKDGNAPEIIMREIARHKIEYTIYKMIFRLFSPKILFYTNNGVIGGVIQAANELGIKTIELQHGTISQTHIAYNSGKFENNICPNYFFSFGEYWHDAIRFGSKKINIGFPYMSLIENSLSKNIIRESNTILVISNGKFERSLFVKITKELSYSSQKYKIYYKLNPSEYDDWKKNYPLSFQTNPNLKIIDNNEKPLNYFYKKAKYLIGSGSTCIYEGVANGMVVFVINSRVSSDAKKLIDNNSLFVVSDTEEILSKIKNGEVPAGKIDKEHIFRRYSHSNIVENIQRILT